MTIYPTRPELEIVGANFMTHTGRGAGMGGIVAGMLLWTGRLACFKQNSLVFLFPANKRRSAQSGRA